MFWMGFMVGALVGSLFGTFFLGIMNLAANTDRRNEKMKQQYQAQQRELYGEDHLD